MNLAAPKSNQQSDKKEMMRPVSYLFLSVFIYIIFPPTYARSLSSPNPHILKSFNPKIKIESAKSCSYTVVIKTSCSSPSYTRDQISLAFGDSYGNEVYLKRLDDPSSGTFERCSSETFKINGPCMYDICYLYLRRKGSDGWKPETVKISGSHIKTVNFYYDLALPNGVWYGFNQCRRRRASLPAIM
ncbi:hypothetical protein JCGZ_13328 [Jatropha curcas]|uniref:Uncharacterized protein n=1 Tax=Jatropha curcas TaxID=180498 RepID=A0A067KBL5_JATCU|nr:embryo-specific protein ATS3A [Jatropha curcas]KDP32403.1 hypothetical protein JCGZ_13328 [Jatropha curcas]